MIRSALACTRRCPAEADFFQSPCWRDPGTRRPGSCCLGRWTSQGDVLRRGFWRQVDRHEKRDRASTGSAFDTSAEDRRAASVAYVEPFFAVHGDHAHAVTSELFPLVSAPFAASLGPPGLYVLPAIGFLLTIASCAVPGDHSRSRSKSDRLPGDLRPDDTGPLLRSGVLGARASGWTSWRRHCSSATRGKSSRRSGAAARMQCSAQARGHLVRCRAPDGSRRVTYRPTLATCSDDVVWSGIHGRAACGLLDVSLLHSVFSPYRGQRPSDVGVARPAIGPCHAVVPRRESHRVGRRRCSNRWRSPVLASRRGRNRDSGPQRLRCLHRDRDVTRLWRADRLGGVARSPPRPASQSGPPWTVFSRRPRGGLRRARRADGTERRRWAVGPSVSAPCVDSPQHFDGGRCRVLLRSGRPRACSGRCRCAGQRVDSTNWVSRTQNNQANLRSRARFRPTGSSSWRASSFRISGGWIRWRPLPPMIVRSCLPLRVSRSGRFWSRRCERAFRR